MENQQNWIKIAPEGRENFWGRKNSRFTKTNKKTLVRTIRLVHEPVPRTRVSALAAFHGN